ncbi:hypothetical protein FEM33_14725 [Dyadobacter flavalbus]|uniref:Glutaminyl-peptide cyclotransferase n=1 Tax=Dyadobacter flavalbus TaxID=2579942 RepID=A0A5M8QVY8_9BACT|nr:hypothetical protein [Dyadobacter flavalbus]KAA6439501.1 hypothetical protein FEM33_14725 [Dyadobacter flavalbus]
MAVKYLFTSIALFLAGLFAVVTPEMRLQSTHTIDSLGACQGASFIEGKLYLYGDREVGMIREYQLKDGSLVYQNKEIQLTQNGNDLINHPTGIAWRKGMPVFIGNSIRLNQEGTLWKAVIHQVDWHGLKKTGTLDGNILSNIDDDACIQGTRPEYVSHKGKWYVATADYGDKKNEVRLYDPYALAKAGKTSEKGVLVTKFSCGPWVQNLHWMEEKGILILVQNQVQGRKWRFTFLDLEKSIAQGSQHVIRSIDIDKADELEGFTFFNKSRTGVAVTSSQKENVHFFDFSW